MSEVKLISWSGSKIYAIKFVRAITGLGIRESKAIVEGVLPATLKEYPTQAQAQQAVDDYFGQHPAEISYIVYEVTRGIPAMLIKTTGIGIVTGDPNGIPELQANHLLSVVQLQDGRKQWAFTPNNNVGEKWVNITDTSKAYYEKGVPIDGEVQFRQIKGLRAVFSAIYATSTLGISPRNTLGTINMGMLGEIANIKTNSSNKIYIAMQTGVDTAEWVLLAEKTW